MPLYLGSTPITSVQLGTTPINAIYLGTTQVWSRAAIRDDFDNDGFLGWINELCTDPGALISDPFGGLVDGLGNPIGSLVGLIQERGQQIGTLISSANTDVAEAYCGMWGGTAPPDGLVGLLNGLPVIGPLAGGALKAFLDLLESIFGGGGDPLDSVESIIGKVPVFGQLGQIIGLSPDSEGNLADPINFIVDGFGAVVGTLTCGQFTPTGGAAEGVCYVIGVVGQMARMLIPDGLISLTPQASRLRFPTLLASDDGYLETQVSNIGAPDFVTQLFRRYANNGGGASGVGIDLRNSMLSLVRRVGGTDTLVKPNLGAFANGDVLRLVQEGNVHSLFRNGELLDAWTDGTGTAAVGAANRSVAMLMQGAKDFQGARRFSPALNYLEAA